MSNKKLDGYQSFIHQSRYARWMPEKGRRENWNETESRYFNYWIDKELLTTEQAKDLQKQVIDLEVMPSMRALMTAGPALDKDDVAAYNCSYIAVDRPSAFRNIMYILMCGTGVGFSVERHCIEKLPMVAEEFHETDTIIKVGDSRPGWAKSLKELIAMLYTGQVPKWDVSDVRPAGARLKTFGGRASGPQPLVMVV